MGQETYVNLIMFHVEVGAGGIGMVGGEVSGHGGCGIADLFFVGVEGDSLGEAKVMAGGNELEGDVELGDFCLKVGRGHGRLVGGGHGRLVGGGHVGATAERWWLFGGGWRRCRVGDGMCEVGVAMLGRAAVLEVACEHDGGDGKVLLAVVADFELELVAEW
jgi:hypothetical protein